MSGKPIAEQEIGLALLSDMVAYAETSVSRENLYFIILGNILIMKQVKEVKWMIICVSQKEIRSKK